MISVVTQKVDGTYYAMVAVFISHIDAREFVARQYDQESYQIAEIPAYEDWCNIRAMALDAIKEKA